MGYFLYSSCVTLFLLVLVLSFNFWKAWEIFFFRDLTGLVPKHQVWSEYSEHPSEDKKHLLHNYQ